MKHYERLGDYGGFEMVRQYYEKELELLQRILNGQTDYQRALDWE